jgi:hypothetical protein
LTPSHCFTLFRGSIGISRASAKQTGKKHGKGTVKASNGFASVAYDSRRKQLVPGFTNRKDVASVEIVASSYF